MIRIICIVLSVLLAACIGPAIRPAYAQSGSSYTTITDVKVIPLSNGVQVRVQADGLLQFYGNDLNGRIMTIFFPDAKNGVKKNFLNVNSYPVSFIQLSTPQGARNGIGLSLQINNFTDTHATIAATPDGQGVLITIQSDRTVEKRRKGPSGGPAADPATADPPPAGNPDTSTLIEYADGHLTLRAVRADIHTLMSAIAEKSGLSIAIDDAVDRKVSLTLAGVTPRSAVQSIATAYGLALSEIDGISMISEGVPTDLATYHLSGTESFRMQNTQAQTVSGLLPNFLYSYVKVNSEQNAVVVTSPSQMLAKIGADLKKVDIPSPQIMIEATVVEFTDTVSKEIGLNWFHQQSAATSSMDNTSGLISYSTIGKLPDDFEVTLKALELSGKARVRARPRMAAVNGRQARIFIGAQRFIQTQFNQYGQTQTRIQSVDVGVKLAVTPLTGGNGEITVRVSPEVSNITELDLQTGLPVLSTRSADTSVRVRDGETIAIGGLTLNQDQTLNRKFPILGDLPLVGGLFRSKKTDTVRTELVIFLTPKIIAVTAEGGKG
jgi:type II secretory pathway component GspD/PulD (secretin)